MNQSAIFQKRNWPAWTAYAVALIGLAVYFVQSIIFAHTTVSNLDEGAYLLKGFLFATGKYHPFDTGISTNKAPLAFLIPGYAQLLFGPGLRTGRYLAVFFGVMTVLGTWVAARRIGGKWLAAGTVWVFAFSPMIIKIYSGGATQSTIACLLAWSLALSLGEKRPLWQLVLSGFLAGLTMLVRQNMLPFLPLLAVYAFWQHGRKAFGLLISGLVVVAAVHIMYWPEILQLWYWVPFIKLPAHTIYSGGGVTVWRPEIYLDSRLLSIFQAVRFHFVALIGSIISILLWPKLSNWKSRSDFRMSVFLLLLFWGLFYMHAMASVGQEYCVYCFTPYIAFFNVAGILLVVVSINSWNWRPSLPVQILLIAGLLVVFAGMGFSAFEDIGLSLLKLPAPRIHGFGILPGFVTWWDILSNKFNASRNSAMRYASIAFGLSAGVFIMLIGYILWRRVWRDSSVKFAAFFAAFVLVLEIVISPVLHGSAGTKDCTSDVILANEQIGEHLKSIIPPGSLVYWNGGLSVAPLLYLRGVNIFPPQINDGYSFVSHGDTAELFRFGYWNEEMDAEWRATADFFIIEEWRYNGWKDFLNPRQFVEFARSPVGTSCLDGSTLRIFRRNIK
jgi:hypothetical protein